jgi:hypothetical protein
MAICGSLASEFRHSCGAAQATTQHLPQGILRSTDRDAIFFSAVRYELGLSGWAMNRFQLLVVGGSEQSYHLLMTNARRNCLPCSHVYRVRVLRTAGCGPSIDEGMGFSHAHWTQ